jgi:hypothetical protein
MPHGNKKSRVSAKKKGRARQGATAVSQPDTSAASSQNVHAAEPPPKDEEINHFLSMQRSLEESSGGRKPFSAADNVKGTLYMRYKKCTQRFKDALQSMVPRAIFGTDTAQALMDAADHVANSDIAVDWRVMSHLKVAIRTRQRVATHKYGDGDMKHAYFVDVLLYCYQSDKSRL